MMGSQTSERYISRRESEVPAVDRPPGNSARDPSRALVDVLRSAWAWAAGRCECKRPGHHHLDRCDTVLVWARRGSDKPGGWYPRLRVSGSEGGEESAENYEVLCSACYRVLSSAQPHRGTA